MLGKRSRALQRTTSSSHIGMDSSSAQNRDKLRPVAITISAPCQIIVGYCNNMPKDVNGEKRHNCPLPESISPRSGLQCLLTDVVWKKELAETTCKSVGLKELAETTCKSVGLSIAIENYGCKGTERSQARPFGSESPFVCSSRQAKPQIVSKSMLPPQCRNPVNDYRCNVSPAAAVYNSVLPSPLPAIDFLDACYLCRRRLGPGQDIYIYRGDRAFCSVECRQKHILADEHMQKCASAALKNLSARSSCHASGHRNRVQGRGLATAA